MSGSRERITVGILPYAKNSNFPASGHERRRKRAMDTKDTKVKDTKEGPIVGVFRAGGRAG